MINRILVSATALVFVVGCETPQPTNTVAANQAAVQAGVQSSITNGGQASPMTLAPAPGQAYQGPRPGSINDFNLVGNRVYFKLNQFRLDDQDKTVLARQAAWLQTYPGVKILVAGNCDERGTRDYNLALGERRAATVRNYLVSLGVDPSRIETISYGKERPIAIGNNEEAYAQNRNGFTQIVSGMVG